MTMLRSTRHALLCLPAIALVALVAAGCGGDDDDDVLDFFDIGDGGNGPAPALGHANILMRDHQGNPIQLGDAVPFSPRQTCGACHDVDEIANGYHFQQGRTDATGALDMADDYYADGREWLKSSGMYGKW
jgi:hypothetical protein